MSIEVRIPKEITEYKEKILFGLSIRQLLCFSIAIFFGVGTYFLISKFLGKDIASYIVIIEVMPVFAIGFIRKNGFTFEKYAAMMFRHKLGINKRKYLPLLDEIKTEKVKERKTKSRRDKINVKEKKQKQKNIRECKLFEVTAKSRKRKSKEANREIKAAKQEYRREKQAAKKAAKKRSRSKVSTAND